jgi:hypothetical protein
MTDKDKILLQQVADKLKGRDLFPEQIKRAKEFLSKMKIQIIPAQSENTTEI